MHKINKNNMLWCVFYNARVFSLRVSTLPQDVVV